ncbi:MAG TPA: DNA polymerase I [Spirochaetia bacterium]|nr:DNA polymerase I [Spirochaetia bacterium]
MDKALYLLDGYGLIYRSYFAFIRKPLRNPEGRNSSAIFGFFRSLIAILNERKPSHLVVALDSRTPTHRHERYLEYKATREKSPEELKEQIPIIEEILAALGVPAVRVDGYEADDIIATYAEMCRKEGRPCFVISSDKDLLQLVDGPVRVLKPGDRSFRELDREAVFDEWGVYPEQIRDYLSLVGDSSDNVPGVRGVGEKTAASLLSQFKTLEGLYHNLDAVSSKSWREKLETGRDSAFLSHDLIGLETDVPVGLSIDALALPRLDGKAAAPYFLKEGIKSLADELSGTSPAAVAGEPVAPAESGSSSTSPETASAAGAENSRGTYQTVRTLDELDEWVARVRKAGWFAFDSETSGVDAMVAEPVGFSLSVKGGEGCYIPLLGPEGTVFPAEKLRERIRLVLEDPKLHLVGQNIKYDYKILKRWGVTMANIAFDTMIAGWLLDTTANTYNMDRLAEDYLDYRTIHYREVISEAVAEDGGDPVTLKVGRGGKLTDGPTFDRVPLDRATEYAAEDADITFRLYRHFEPLLREHGLLKLFSEVEMPLVRILADMEMEGVGLDVKRLGSYSTELADELDGIRKKIYELCGKEFNIASTKQLQEVLFTDRKLKPGKKTKTGYSTDNDVLVELAREDPVPELVLRYRMLAKLKSTYVDALPAMVNATTGRVHSHFVQTGTATGRISSKDPNLQNIPIREEEGRRIREAFVPAKGRRYVSADYSQIELVVLAHLSGDPGLAAAFTSGQDVHRQTGALIFGLEPAQVTDAQRRMAKTINFGVMYGMSAFRLSRELGISRGDADRFMEAYFTTYSRIKAFIDEIVKGAEETGAVRTLMGRERRIPTITSSNRTEKMGAERIAVNTPIQGTAADIVKLAMIHIDDRLRREKRESKLILQVHDELILECPTAEVPEIERLLEEEMSSAVKLSVPLKVHVESGASWGELH